MDYLTQLFGDLSIEDDQYLESKQLTKAEHVNFEKKYSFIPQFLTRSNYKVATREKQEDLIPNWVVLNLNKLVNTDTASYYIGGSFALNLFTLGPNYYDIT